MENPMEIRKGRKVDPRAMDRAKMGVALVQSPQSGEVQGQQKTSHLVSCPCLGHVTWADLDSDLYTWFTCGVCGCPFQA
jgi:hypothetical protein